MYSILVSLTKGKGERTSLFANRSLSLSVPVGYALETGKFHNIK